MSDTYPQPGDTDTFYIENIAGYRSGTVRRIYTKDEQTYLILYAHYTRAEETYILTSKGTLRQIHGTTNGSPQSDPVKKALNTEGAHTPKKHGYDKLQTIIAVTGIVIFTILIFYPVLRNSYYSLYAWNLDYQDFLSASLSPSGLVSLVQARIAYTSDPQNIWYTPETAWETGRGDCEEFAALCAVYYRSKGEKAYLIAVHQKDSLEGHVIALIEKNNNYLLIDPTQAVIQNAIVRHTKNLSLPRALAEYLTLPVSMYDIPKIDGESQFIKRIHPYGNNRH